MASVVYVFNPRLDTFVVHENVKEGSWLVAPNLPSSYLLRDSDYIEIFDCFSIFGTILIFLPQTPSYSIAAYLLKKCTTFK